MPPIDFKFLAETIKSMPCPHPVRLVAIDGRSGSGKSTFAHKLNQHLGAEFIPLDDFIAWDDLQDWWPRFEEQVLTPLFAGQSIRYQQRDWEHDTPGRGLGPWRSLPPTQLLLIEGVGAARRAVRRRLCWSAWIETPRQLCLQRGLARDAQVPNAGQLWANWMPLQDEFMQKECSADTADLVVDGSVAWE
jgi:uridine kinase